VTAVDPVNSCECCVLCVQDTSQAVARRFLGEWDARRRRAARIKRDTGRDVPASVAGALATSFAPSFYMAAGLKFLCVLRRS